MDFMTAVRTCLSKYATFSGRAARSEYWWFVLFIFLCNAAAGILDFMLFGGADIATAEAGGTVGASRPISSLTNLALFLPSLAAAVRRMHDLDRSGWWVLIGLIPIVGVLVLIYFYVQRGTEGANRFGEEPAAART